MTTNDFKELLDKFYNAESTAEEESKLKKLFKDDAVPEGFEADRALFDTLNATVPAVPQDMSKRIERDMDRWNTFEAAVARKARTANTRWTVGVAAGLLLLFGIGNYYNQPKMKPQPYAGNLMETYENVDDAAAETERALTKFSTAINKGLRKIDNTKKD